MGTKYYQKQPMFSKVVCWVLNTGLKWVKEPLVNRFKVLRNIY